MIICITDGTSANDAHWTVVQNNVDVMGAATASAAGTSGLVPAPAAGKQGQFLRGDGTWATPSTGTDTKNTAGSTNKASTKLFLVGATEQSANPATYSNSAVYIGTDNCLYSNSTKVSVEGHTHSYASTGHKHTINSHTHSVTIPATEVGVTPSTTSVYSITAVGTLPALTVTTKKPSKITAWSAGTLPTLTEITNVSGGTTTTVLTGVKVTANPTISFTANSSTATGRVKYVESISSTKASLGGTVTFNTDAIKNVTATLTDTSTDGPAVVTAITGGGASLSGTTSFNTDAIKDVTLSASTSTSAGPKYVESISGGAPSLGGTVTFNTDAIKDFTLAASTSTSAGPKYVESISGSAPSLTGTKTFVTGYSSFSGGSISTTTCNTVNASYDSTTETLTLTAVTPIASVTHTPASLGTASTGTVGIQNGSYSATTKYMSHSNTAATTGTVTISGGSYSATTKYMAHENTAASKASVSISNSNATVTTKYLKLTGEAASTGTVTVSGGTTTATTKYLSATASGTTIGADGTADAYTTLSTDTIQVATTTGTLPSLTYSEEAVGSASGWSAGTLPTKGSAQTVMTGVTATFPETTVTTGGSGTLTSNTPS